VAELLVLGSITGFLAGLLGVGGGMMMVPFMTWILSLARGRTGAGGEDGHRHVDGHHPVHVGVQRARAPRARRRALGSAEVAGAGHRAAAGLLSGAGLFAVLKGQGLALFFALFVGFSATQMLLDRKPKPSRQMPGPLGQGLVGSGIGLVSGLVGAGGAFLSVPFMTWCNVPLRQAVGTSAALGFPIALANTVGYVVAGWAMAPALPGAIGYLYLPALLIAAAASMAMAPRGRARGAPHRRGAAQAVFALLLFGLAAYMALPSTQQLIRRRQRNAGQRDMVAATAARFGQRRLAGDEQRVERLRGVREAGHAHGHGEAQLLAVQQHDLRHTPAPQAFHARMGGGQAHA
jgi:uncharacterized membrane protein YfcA